MSTPRQFKKREDKPPPTKPGQKGIIRSLKSNISQNITTYHLYFEVGRNQNFISHLIIRVFTPKPEQEISQGASKRPRYFTALYTSGTGSLLSVSTSQSLLTLYTHTYSKLTL